MKKIILISLVLTTALISYAQVSLSAGAGIANGFSSNQSFTGLNGGFEMPRSNDVTFYGRIGHYFSRKGENTNTTSAYNNNPNDPIYSIQASYLYKFNYTTIEGGTRYYVMNDYDNGFSAYGGTNFMLSFNSIKRKYERDASYGVDIIENWQNNYSIDPNENEDATIMNLSLGLQGGVKYTIAGTGTVYFDVSGQYTIFNAAQNENFAQNYLNSFDNQYSRLFFIFSVGFRKDLY